MKKLFDIGEITEAKVVKRPSQHCKTPYVADVTIDGTSEFMAHTAALGCCGLADVDASVLMTHVENKKNVCKHKIMLSKICDEKTKYIQIVGIDPKLAEKIVDHSLEKNLIHILKNHAHFTREVTKLNSRFDFAGIDQNGQEFVLEVKNVPLADFVDCTSKERKKIDVSGYKYDDKISYFPDGYRKTAKSTISPRALKHVEELTELVRFHNTRAILCFVIQRTDSSSFQPSVIDPIYRLAVQKAHFYGVEIVALVTHWNANGECYFVKDNLPVNIYDNSDVLPANYYD